MLFYPEYDHLVSWTTLLGASGAYLVGSVLLYFARRNAEPLTLRLPVAVYNAVQVVLCGWMSWAFFVECFSLGNPMGINSAFTPRTEFIMLVHLASKWLDYTDTAIMILKHNWRQISFLHVYHHVSIALVWGYLLQNGETSFCVSLRPQFSLF